MDREGDEDASRTAFLKRVAGPAARPRAQRTGTKARSISFTLPSPMVPRLVAVPLATETSISVEPATA